MPYIPPPRPPPAPRPPVFRPPVPPPGPSIHQQQMRIHQQHQQQFRQQQQIRQFHQTQQQFLANQHQMQLDRNRQHQMQIQQQVQRQQQDNFRQQQQLQQENLRRQQQDQLRCQQQFHQDQARRQQQLPQNHQEQLRRQQQLLRGLQTTSESTGSSVFISPAFTFEISGLPQVQVTAQGAEGVNLDGTAVNTDPLPPDPSAPPAPHSNPQGAGFYPPPYSAAPPLVQSLPPQPGPEAQLLPPKLAVSLPPQQLNGGPHFRESSPPFSPQPAPPKLPRQLNKNEIVLRDGTIITIRSKDEYVFVGPTSQQMVVNCLPLFTPRPQNQQGAGDSATTSGTENKNGGKTETEEKPDVQSSMHELMHEPRKQERRQTKAMRRFVLKKAPSAENLLNTASASPKMSDQKKRWSEAEDILDANTRNGVKVQRNMWTHFNSSPPANSQVDKDVHPDSLLATTSTELAKEGNTEVEKGWEVMGKEDSEEVDTGGAGNQDEGRGNVQQSFSDGGSDGEESKEMRVSYIDNPEQVQTLKRSSGSVSFIGRASPLLRVSTSPPPPSVEEDMTEEEEGEGREEEGEEEASVAAVVDSAPVVQVVGSGEGDGKVGEREGVEMVRSESRDDTDGAVEKMPPTGDEAGEKNDGDIPKPKPDAGKAELGPHPQEAAGGVSEKAGLIHATLSTPTAPPQASPNFVPLTSNTVPLTSVPTVQAVQQLTATPLPLAPMTFEPEFIERSGWLMKLSHRRGVFGDKWQKRYFVLHGSWLYYFKKYGDSIPRGAIRLHPRAWVKPIAQGTARQSDAVSKTPPNAIISVVRCFGVHRPDNFASSLSNLLSQDGIAEVFRSQTISVSNSDSRSRTFYMITPSNEERSAWVDAIQNNIQAHALSESALETSCKELRNMLRAVQSFPPSSDLSPLLSLLHTRTRELFSRHSSRKEQ